MKSFFKFLSRNLLYTIIEAAGLILSLAFVLLIGNYTASQIGVLHENPYWKQVYSVDMQDYPGLTYGFTDLAKERIPEVNASAAFIWDNTLIKINDEFVSGSATGVNRDFFEVFPYYRLHSGNADMINSTSQVFVSRSFADTHSLSEGMSIGVGRNGDEMTVCGIIDDFDGTLLSHADIVMSSAKMKQLMRLPDYDQFGNAMTFIRVDEGSDMDDIYAKVEAVCKDVYPFYGSAFFSEVKLDRIDTLFFKDFDNSPDHIAHGDRDVLRILILVGLLMLLSAVFNYLNLNIALTGRRSREMAIRRLTGASRGSIFAKYIAESVLFTSICVCLSLLLAVFITPAMNVLLNDPSVPMGISFAWEHIAVYILFTLVVGAVTGLTPAVLASRFNPVEIVKGEFRVRSKKYFSKVFIVFQNALTVFMIALSLVMECQYRTAMLRPLNAKVKDVYYLLAYGFANGQDKLINELEQLPCVKRVGLSLGVPGARFQGQYSKTRDGEDILYSLYRMDTTAFSILDIQVEKDFGAPQFNSVWFGDRAFKATGFDDDFHDTMSTTLAQRAEGCEQVAGVVKEFPAHINDPNDDSYMIICLQRREDLEFYGLLIETTGDQNAAKEAIDGAFARATEDENKIGINWSCYLEDNFKEQMRPVRNNTSLIEIFMLLSLVISFMGLLAMSTYFAREKSKDIALRKVFGGTVRTETLSSVRQYMIQVAVAIAAGIPLAVFAADKYLQQFVYKLEGYWWIFVVAALGTFFIALAAVLWQTLQSARRNPSEVLSKE